MEFQLPAEDGAPDIDAQQAITELGAASLAILRTRLKLAIVQRGEAPLAAPGRFAPVRVVCGRQRAVLIARYAGVCYSRTGIRIIMVVASI